MLWLQGSPGGQVEGVRELQCLVASLISRCLSALQVPYFGNTEPRLLLPSFPVASLR